MSLDRKAWSDDKGDDKGHRSVCLNLLDVNCTGSIHREGLCMSFLSFTQRISCTFWRGRTKRVCFQPFPRSLPFLPFPAGTTETPPRDTADNHAT